MTGKLLRIQITSPGGDEFSGPLHVYRQRAKSFSVGIFTRSIFCDSRRPHSAGDLVSVVVTSGREAILRRAGRGWYFQSRRVAVVFRNGPPIAALVVRGLHFV